MSEQVLNTEGRSRPGRARRTEKVSEVVAREIVHDIVRRDLQPGSMLPPESVMLRTYDIGRASLREALRILEVQGLITIKPGPGGGPVVAGVSSRDFGRMATLYFHVSRATFRELFEARLVMEPVMARLAAERIDEELKAEFKDVLEQMRSAIATQDSVAYGLSATAFHSVVAGVSGNGVLDLFGRALKDIYTDRVLGGVVFPESAREEVASDHEAIARAIMKGEASRAERLMREHMVEFMEYVFERTPGLKDEIIDWR
jgi:GntR family transcriptional regulator, transcriptional repressor for pyruvate dehydrogenase complex